MMHGKFWARRYASSLLILVFYLLKFMIQSCHSVNIKNKLSFINKEQVTESASRLNLRTDLGRFYAPKQAD